MAVSNITIDLEAYTLLVADKRPGESFSCLIKRRLRPTCTAAGLLAALPRCRLAEDTLEAMEALVRTRGIPSGSCS